MTLTLTYAVKDILLSNFWLRRFSPSFVITSQVIDKKKKIVKDNVWYVWYLCTVKEIRLSFTPLVRKNLI